MSEKGLTNVMMINAEYGAEAARATVGTLEDRVKASMRAVLEENWMDRKQMTLFQAAMAGALMSCDSGDGDWHQIVDSLEALRKVGAFLELAKIGFKADMPPLGMNATLPLYVWWHEVFAATKTKIPVTE
jgi:hypothetical protein